MIDVRHLTKRYGTFTAVDDISFEVRPGEVLGFLGPNGAGKTTTMRMLTGFLPATAGRIVIDRFDLFEHPIEAKRQIGYLPENPPVYPDMTVTAYLEFVAEIKDVRDARRRAQIDAAIEKARLIEVRHKRIGTLSKGFRQRVGLAQAIVHEPPVLILDEPTSSLDPKQRVEVRDLIAALKGHHTVVLSTHILPEASQISDRVIIIDHGRFVAVDSPANLDARLKAQERVHVEVEGPPRAVAEALGSVAHVTRVTVAPPPDAPLANSSAEDSRGTAPRRAHYQLESAVGTDVRGDVAALVASRGWKLLGLSTLTLSLEEIFLRLTADEAVEEKTR